MEHILVVFSKDICKIDIACNVFNIDYVVMHGLSDCIFMGGNVTDTFDQYMHAIFSLNTVM
eukprot:6164421-Ditylum_brightwellii.AAC.1